MPANTNLRKTQNLYKFTSAMYSNAKVMNQRYQPAQKSEEERKTDRLEQFVNL